MDMAPLERDTFNCIKVGLAQEQRTKRPFRRKRRERIALRKKLFNLSATMRSWLLRPSNQIVERHKNRRMMLPKENPMARVRTTPAVGPDEMCSSPGSLSKSICATTSIEQDTWARICLARVKNQWVRQPLCFRHGQKNSRWWP